MKVQVITRSFFEDAYLDFFIKYYLKLGFDRIVILKADKKDLAYIYENSGGEYKMPDTLTEEEKSKVVIKYVENEGNGIYQNPDNFHFFSDTNYDWTLHIDLDEYLIFSMDENKTVHDYINNVHKVMDKKEGSFQAIKFRWLCINKLNNNWKAYNASIINEEFKDLENTDFNLLNMKGYIATNNLESYRFIKTLYYTKHLVNNPKKMDAHVSITKPEIPKPTYVLDNNIITYNRNRGLLFTKENSNYNFCNGFILHFNTRSYSNSLTKCLVTQLRENKKIKSLPDFRNFINNLELNELENLDISNENQSEKIRLLKSTYKDFLNSKSFFPNKIKLYHNKYDYLIKRENYINQLKSVLDNLEDFIQNNNFIDLEKENAILDMLCKEKGIDYTKLKHILKLFI